MSVCIYSDDGEKDDGYRRGKRDDVEEFLWVLWYTFCNFITVRVKINVPAVLSFLLHFCIVAYLWRRIDWRSFRASLHVYSCRLSAAEKKMSFLKRVTKPNLPSPIAFFVFYIWIFCLNYYWISFLYIKIAEFSNIITRLFLSVVSCWKKKSLLRRTTKRIYLLRQLFVCSIFELFELLGIVPILRSLVVGILFFENSIERFETRYTIEKVLSRK